MYLQEVSCSMNKEVHENVICIFYYSRALVYAYTARGVCTGVLF